MYQCWFISGNRYTTQCWILVVGEAECECPKKAYGKLSVLSLIIAVNLKLKSRLLIKKISPNDYTSEHI